MLIPVKDKKLVRDSSNKALISTDLEGIQAYKTRRMRDEASNMRINIMEERIGNMENMLKQILEKLK